MQEQLHHCSIELLNPKILDPSTLQIQKIPWILTFIQCSQNNSLTQAMISQVRWKSFPEMFPHASRKQQQPWIKKNPHVAWKVTKKMMNSPTFLGFHKDLQLVAGHEFYPWWTTKPWTTKPPGYCQIPILGWSRCPKKIGTKKSCTETTWLELRVSMFDVYAT